MYFKNKTAIVTGASRGIGKAIALAFAEKGAAVAVIYAGNTAAALETVEEIQKLNVPCAAYQCNVANYSETETVIKKIIEDFGGVDILVNNAGITKDALIHAMKEEDFDNVIDVNLKGAFNTTKHLYRHFMRRAGSRIINISSVVGLCGNKGQANYAAAKAGLIGLTKSTAKELASRNVTCNAIAPGFIASDMTDAIPEKARTAMLATIPAGRVGTPKEVAELATFLASEHGAYITGQVISIDGGLNI